MEDFKILLKRSENVVDGKPVLPTSLDEGEISINYAKGYETLATVNNAGEIVSIPFNSDLQKLSDSLNAHQSRNDNPHGVTKAQVGLGNVDNTSDSEKPISIPQRTAIDSKLNNAANGGVVNNLTTNDSTKALSAAQGIELSKKIDTMTGGAVAGLEALESRVTSLEEEVNGDITYIDQTLAPKAKTFITNTI